MMGNVEPDYQSLTCNIVYMSHQILKALLSQNNSNIKLEELLHSVLSNRYYASQDCIEKARFLLAMGADPNHARCIPLESVVNYAYNTELNMHLLQLLLDFGALPDRKNKQGVTPIQTCVFTCQYGKAKIILKSFHSKKLGQEFWKILSDGSTYFCRLSFSTAFCNLQHLFETGKPNLIHYLHTIGYPAGVLFTPSQQGDDSRRMIANLNDPALIEEWMQLMDIVNNEILSLKLLTRITIRSQLYNKINNKVMSLALPEKIKSYLMLADYPEI